ncbi:MAG: glyoxylate/hydroxypyruvate reductase A [Acetobacteraceae bacterium]|nr:glyoxylate/hydroxypyruvate reductase A [Acetobacteraceae bacterium]
MLLVKSGGATAFPEWERCFAEFVPALEVRAWDDPLVDPEEVRYVLCWEPAPGWLVRFPNLRLIISSGAEVDHILCDPYLPLHIPIVRMGGGATVAHMADFVRLGCFALLRDMRRIMTNQAERHWEEFGVPRSSAETRVGVMGLGMLGGPAAAALRDCGFITAGWSRRRRTIPGVRCFEGNAELAAFLSRTDILVNLLPRTSGTHAIIDADTLALLPPGAAVLNVGRGAHLVLDDLLLALAAGHISGAFLDVFDPEPLPADHPVWGHPRIIVSTHVAAIPSRRDRARFVAEAITVFERGETPENLYDSVRGY